MKKYFLLSFAISLFASAYTQNNGVPIYSIDNNNMIISSQAYISNDITYSNNFGFSTSETASVSINQTTYTIKEGRFDGWGNQPGNYDVIELYKNGTCVLTFKIQNGIVILNDINNNYASRQSKYSTNGYFIEQTLTSTSKALLFLGYNYSTDPANLIIFILTEDDAKLVFCRPMAIQNIERSSTNFSVDLLSDIMYEDHINLPLSIRHTIWLEDGVLKFKDND